MNRPRLLPASACLALWACAAQAAGELTVHDASLRFLPGDTAQASGYATLGNSGDAPITILTAQSDTFRSASLLKTVTSGNHHSEREMISLDLAPGASVTLAPGGLRLALDDPRHPVVAGDEVGVVFLLADGTRVLAHFDVVAPGKAPG
jgi:copper(I)-binding protein